MRRHQHLERLFATTASLLLPTTAIASDYSGFIYFFAGIAVVLTLFIGVVAYFATRNVKSVILRSIVWGTLIALVVSPANLGGSGTSAGPPIFDLVIFAFSGDPAYAVGSLKALAISAPLSSLLVAMLLWGRPKPSGR